MGRQPRRPERRQRRRLRRRARPSRYPAGHRQRQPPDRLALGLESIRRRRGDTPANEAPTGLAAFRYSLRFPGQQYDPETQSHYNYFRDYEPGTGRYLESDPIGQWSDLQTYQFVRATPLRSADWSGLALEIESLGTGISQLLPLISPCKPGMNSNSKGRAGEAAMAAFVAAMGYLFEPPSTVKSPGLPTVRPDGYAHDPKSGKRFVLDSKCGPCARMTKNQRVTYPALAKSGGFDGVLLFWWR
ncbi:RHS repeat-associated core domain-containing protein [Dokdonella immobilis]|uniref:RHS repeat-associated core domain-containing protein n=1 Tax=Dokdonella immobilis TaxID=578942 RepID=UPI000B8812F4